MLRQTFVGGLSLVLFTTALALPASGIDYPVAGTQLTLRERNDKASLTLLLRDGSVPVPTSGSADDPSLAGLYVTLFSRATGEQAAYGALPGAGQNSWQVRSTAKAVTYSYRNGTATRFGGDIQTISMRSGSGVKVRSKAYGLVLLAPQGAVAVRVQYGSVRVCALFDGASVRADKVGVFTASKAAAGALGNCNDDTLAGTAPAPCGGTFPSCEGACPAGETCGALGGGTDPTCQCLPD